ncbi:MAG: hypothetical protein IKQ71_00320 [Lachnospiraceae bacterium]|nr:hypothetical protein [Lachnospiraceae bacterium]
MKEVEINEELDKNKENAAIAKLREDYEKKTKLAADTYQFNDSPEFKKYAEKGKSYGWNIEDPVELKALHAIYTITNSDPSYVEFGEFIVVKNIKDKGSFISEALTSVDVLAYDIGEQFPKEKELLDSLGTAMEEFWQKEEEEIVKEQKAAKEKSDKEKLEKLKQEKQKEEERLAKLGPKERMKEELKILRDNDMDAFAKKLLSTYVNKGADSEEVEACVNIVKWLNKDQCERLRHELLYHTVVQSSRILNAFPFFEQEYGDQFKAFENKKELMMDAHILNGGQIYLNAYTYFIDRFPPKYRESDITYQARMLPTLNEADVADFQRVQHTTERRLIEHGITIDTNSGSFKMTISEEGLKRAKEARKHNESIKAAENAFDRFDGYRRVLIEQLEDFKAQLQYTQDDPEANFEGTKTEGSKEYRAMAKALKEAIADLKNTDKSPVDIIGSLDNVTKKAFHYWDEKIGITGGPHTDNGKLRFGIAQEMVDRVKHYKKQFSKLSDAVIEACNGVEDVYIADDVSMKELADGVKDIVELGNQYYVKNPENYADDYARQLLLDTDKAFFKVRLKERNAFDLQNVNGFDPHRANASASQLAKNYLTKKYLTMLNDPKLNDSKVKDLTADIMSGEFEKQAKRIAENPIFKDLVKKKPGNWFSDWDTIEKNVISLADTAEESLFSAKRKFKSVEEYVIYHNDAPEGGLVIADKDTMYKNLADAVVKSMLSDPKYDAVRYTIATKPDKKEELLTVAESYLKKEKVLGSRDLINKNDAVKKVTDTLKSGSIKTDIVKKFADREKRLARENKAANVNKNKTVENNKNIKL